MQKRLMSRRRAFTLIELLVVLVILALLAGLVLPKFLAQLQNSKPKAAMTQIADFKTAVNLYMLDNNGQPPTTQQGLDALVNEPSSQPKPASWKKYMDVPSIPKDPWGNDYKYEAPGPNGEEYLITSYGADGRPGGNDNDKDILSSDLQGNSSGSK